MFIISKKREGEENMTNTNSLPITDL